jgi:hypothetical protein
MLIVRFGQTMADWPVGGGLAAMGIVAARTPFPKGLKQGLPIPLKQVTCIAELGASMEFDIYAYVRRKSGRFLCAHA